MSRIAQHSVLFPQNVERAKPSRQNLITGIAIVVPSNYSSVQDFNFSIAENYEGKDCSLACTIE